MERALVAFGCQLRCWYSVWHSFDCMSYMCVHCVHRVDGLIDGNRYRNKHKMIIDTLFRAFCFSSVVIRANTWLRRPTRQIIFSIMPENACTNDTIHSPLCDDKNKIPFFVITNQQSHIQTKTEKWLEMRFGKKWYRAQLKTITREIWGVHATASRVPIGNQ